METMETIENKKIDEHSIKIEQRINDHKPEMANV
jgi:hypothetical protein